MAFEVLLTLEGVASDGILAKLRFVVLVGKETVEGRESDVVVTMWFIVHLLIGRVEVVEESEDLPKSQLDPVLLHHLMELVGRDFLMN